MLSSIGIRFLLLSSYVAFFQVDDADATVHVLRILYEHSNWAAILKNDLLRS